MKLLSIAIPCYNSQDYMERCIHSLLPGGEDVEILIHIGLDTVQLNGEGFEAMVQCGDKVKKGQLLIAFDKELIEGKGYCLETPVIITNSDDFLDVVETAEGEVEPGNSLVKILK